ncbi:hypothetical protein [Streptomyces sp. NPDC058451]|uniref:hypothetical protein n=1 Tax=Streptomyces sp. NPDC058451 TaxID=3346506 RepID=UPI003661CEB0
MLAGFDHAEDERPRAPADDPNVMPFLAQRVQRHAILGGLIHEYSDASSRSTGN